MPTYKNPVLKKGNHKITSPFGMRTISGRKQMHNGVDFVGKNSTLDYIIAAADGTVTISKYSDSAGEYVQIDHGNKVYTRYLHMKKGSRKVKVGAKVKKGTVLGYMGSTGNSTGAHLHFDININGEYADPIPYLDGIKPIIKQSKKVNTKVLEWQKAAIKDGFKITTPDGVWDSNCESIAKKAICKKRTINKYKNLNKIVQKAVGAETDGKFGKETKAAVIMYQSKHGLTDDGSVGLATWRVILNIK